MIHDLVVIGAGPTGLSIASAASRSGLERILILESSERAVPFEALGRFPVTVRFRAQVEKVEVVGENRVLVETTEESFTTRLLITVKEPEFRSPEFESEASVAGRIHIRRVASIEPAGMDVLVVGRGDDAVSAVVDLVAAGANVVVAFLGKISSLSELAREVLTRLEHDRRITVLWHSEIQEVVDSHGFPMVYWVGRMTPALQFDHIVVIEPAEQLHSGEVPLGPSLIVDPMADEDHLLGPARAWDSILAAGLVKADRPVARPPSPQAEQLRLEHYNATITDFDHFHEDLWVIRLQPDRADISRRAGQYATLGLGYWEPRVDDAIEQLTNDQRHRLIRRSYSISSPIVDEAGYLIDPRDHEWMEFYIVRVPLGGDRVPALTPRLAAKHVGDRVYLGPKIAGRYTLDAVTDPDIDVVFLATGTGEAPHNAMLNELLRKGHRGGIVSVVSVRHMRDLGYLDTHRMLADRFSNYDYITLPTREPGVPKRYVQDYIESGELAGMLPSGLDPQRTHVYLCGNPSMIGPPKWENSTPRFEDESSAVAVLYARGLIPDRRRRPGQVHFEEYW